MAGPLPPEDVAEYDQLMAGESERLDRALEVLRRDIAERGEAAAITHLGHSMAHHLPADIVIGLALAALQRLARQDPGAGT
jgi:hypothetical protein